MIFKFHICVMMTNLDTDTNTAKSPDGCATGEDVELLLSRFVPASPSEELYGELFAAFESGLSGYAEDGADSEVSVGDMVPVSVPEDRIKAWGRLMDEAARQVTEEKLKDLKAVPPSEFKLMRWLMSVENTVPEKARDYSFIDRIIDKIPANKRLRLWAVSAAATFMLIGGALFFNPLGESSGSLVQQGDISRERLNIENEGIHWNAEKGVAERMYNVHYKDTLEVIDKDGSQMLITVPAAQRVSVPIAEVY